MITGRPRQGRLHKAPRCPTCRRILDGWTSVGHENPPEVGGVTVCAFCGSILEFDAGCLAFALLSDKEIKKLEPEIQRQLRASQKIVEEIRRHG